MKKLVITVCYTLSAIIYTTNAQTITKIDTLSGTELKISSSKDINDVMEKLEGKCAKGSTVSTNTEKSWNNTDRNESDTNNSAYKDKISVPTKKLTTAEICKKNPRIMGYKIQLTVVKSNTEANEVKAYFRRRFPYIKVETDASLRPNYKILAGSYFSKASAAEDLNNIRKYFKSAASVQYYIFCEEGK